MVCREARTDRQEDPASDLGQRELACLQRGEAVARKTQPPGQGERKRSEDRELPSAKAESVAERHRAQVGAWQAQSSRTRRTAWSLRTRRQGLPSLRLSALRASLHFPGGRLIVH